MEYKILAPVIIFGLLINGCGGSDKQSTTPSLESTTTPAPTPTPETSSFYFGNDLSYTNEMEDCGAVYRQNDEVVDPFTLMSSHGTNLVRVRHWNDPGSWMSMIPQEAEIAANRQPAYSDLADVTKTISRAKAAGMDVLLGIHYSDIWADPARQVLPRAWENIYTDENAMAAAVYDYTIDVLTSLNDQGLLPEIIKIGNESNAGMMNTQNLLVELNNAMTGLDLSSDGLTNFSDQFQGRMYNAGISAVRDFSDGMDNPPLIALHVAGIESALWFYQKMMDIGVTDFDIAGFSFYYGWEPMPLEDLELVITAMKLQFPEYSPMLVETGYLWDEENGDSLSNLINASDPDYQPVSKQNQLKYMVDLSQTVADAGGIGVIFWEPTWVSTGCRTPWGQGSSQEHVAYFDYRDNFNFHIGGQWMGVEQLSHIPTKGLDTTFTLDMTDQDTSKGVFISGNFTEDTIQPMFDKGDSLYSYSTKVPIAEIGNYHFLLALDGNIRETVPVDCADPADIDSRPYIIGTTGAQNFAYSWGRCSFDFVKETLTELIVNVEMSNAS